VVNPEHLRNQVEGSLIMGLGGALFEAMEFEEGRITTDRLSRYRVPRFSDVPSIEVVLLDRKDLPSEGAGETPIVGVAPAVAGAIFEASGIRLRSLPLVPRGGVREAQPSL
jgi:isoquinoline 1-oxidoreductase